jgi:hypothetical protein
LKAAEAQRRQRLHLQTAYGQATMYSKGFAAEETKAAFARAAELAAKTDDFSQRFALSTASSTITMPIQSPSNGSPIPTKSSPPSGVGTKR